MRKKSLYIGLALIAVSIIVFIASGALLKNAGSGLKAINVTAGRDNYTQVHVNQDNYSFTEILVAANSSTNIYLLNNSIYSAFNSYIAANKSRSGASYIAGIGLNRSYVFLHNTTAIGYMVSLTQNPDIANGFYVVIDNTAGSPSANQLVYASVQYISYDYSQGYLLLAVLGVDFVIFIAGIGFTIYGLVKKEKSAVVEVENTDSGKSTKKGKKGQ